MKRVQISEDEDVDAAQSAAPATGEDVHRQDHSRSPTRRSDDLALASGQPKVNKADERYRAQMHLPYSSWCRAGQHWACYGRRGHHRAGGQPCQCRCHQAASATEGVPNSEDRHVYQVPLTAADLQLIQLCSRWMCSLDLAPDIRARLVQLERRFDRPQPDPTRTRTDRGSAAA